MERAKCVGVIVRRVMLQQSSCSRDSVPLHDERAMVRRTRRCEGAAQGVSERSKASLTSFRASTLSEYFMHPASDTCAWRRCSERIHGQAKTSVPCQA